MTTKGERSIMTNGLRMRNALALVLTLALGGFARAAHAESRRSGFECFKVVPVDRVAEDRHRFAGAFE